MLLRFDSTIKIHLPWKIGPCIPRMAGSSARSDAVFQTFNGMNMLRQISEPQFRFMGIVSDGGVAPNIIPEMASATIWVRYFTDETKLGSVSPKKQGV